MTRAEDGTKHILAVAVHQSLELPSHHTTVEASRLGVDNIELLGYPLTTIMHQLKLRVHGGGEHADVLLDEIGDGLISVQEVCCCGKFLTAAASEVR